MRALAASICLMSTLLAPACALGASAEDLMRLQREYALRPLGERIALLAEAFVGTPYDADPLGAYVTRRAVVADDAVDCMYHVFRSVELAVSGTPEEAAQAALGLRFRTQGLLDAEGRVANYGERFEYGLDMLRSGKWGRDVTEAVAPGLIARVEGARGVAEVSIIPGGAVARAEAALESGDILYFIKDPSRRVVGEVVGHMGVIKVEGGRRWLIHASGRKGQGGGVVKVPLLEYTSSMPFIGVMVGRF